MAHSRLLLLLGLPAKNRVNYENGLTRLAIVKVWKREFEFGDFFEISISECWRLAELLLEFEFPLDGCKFANFIL